MYSLVDTLQSNKPLAGFWGASKSGSGKLLIHDWRFLFYPMCNGVNRNAYSYCLLQNWQIPSIPSLEAKDNLDDERIINGLLKG